MDDSLLPAYYAGGAVVYLPFATSEVALRYISSKKPDFIVLLEYSQEARPYLKQWFASGIPDERARLIYEVADPQHEGIKIYRWEPGKSGLVRPAASWPWGSNL